MLNIEQSDFPADLECKEMLTSPIVPVPVPTDMQLFTLFMVIDKKGDDCWYFTPTTRGGNQTVDPTTQKREEMKRHGSATRNDRIDLLAAAYAIHEVNEVSPFDLDEYAI